MHSAGGVHATAATSPLQGARRAILRRIAGSSYGYRLFQGLGRCYGIEGISADGEFGRVAGPLDDAAVLRAYVINGFWARAANRFFCEFFSDAGGGTYIDVGANLGLTTIPVAQNPKVTCRAFEPAPRNFKYLSHNISENCPHKNVGTYNVALFDRQTTLNMVLLPLNSGDARVRENPTDRDRNSTPTVQVGALRLDDVLKLDDLPRPIAAKIVTQGAEAKVMAGGRSVLGAAEVVVFEFDPALIGEIDNDITVVTDFMASHFATAAMVSGPDFETADLPAPFVWRPVNVVIDEMREMMRRAPAGAEYRYVYLRRSL